MRKSVSNSHSNHEADHRFRNRGKNVCIYTPLGLTDDFFRRLLLLSQEFADDILNAIRQKDIESLLNFKATHLIEELWGLRDSSRMVKFQDTKSQNIILKLASLPSFPLLEKGCATLKTKLVSIRIALQPPPVEGELENDNPPLIITLKEPLAN